MSAVRLPPDIELRRQISDARGAGSDQIVGPEVVNGPAEVAYSTTQRCQPLHGLFEATTGGEHEAVGQPSGAVECLLAITAKPDRDRARGFRQQSGAVDPVEAAGEVDDRFGEQSAQELDLLLLTRT